MNIHTLPPWTGPLTCDNKLSFLTSYVHLVTSRKVCMCVRAQRFFYPCGDQEGSMSLETSGIHSPLEQGDNEATQSGWQHQL